MRLPCELGELPERENVAPDVSVRYSGSSRLASLAPTLVRHSGLERLATTVAVWGAEAQATRGATSVRQPRARGCVICTMACGRGVWVAVGPMRPSGRDTMTRVAAALRLLASSMSAVVMAAGAAACAPPAPQPACRPALHSSELGH